VNAFDLQKLAVTSAKVGVVSAIALYGVYQLGEGFSSRLAAQEQQLAVVAQKLDAHQQVLALNEANRSADARVQRQLLRGICLGVNRHNPSAIALCDQGQ
jgi:hypothetical protein